MQRLTVKKFDEHNKVHLPLKIINTDSIFNFCTYIPGLEYRKEKPIQKRLVHTSRDKY